MQAVCVVPDLTTSGGNPRGTLLFRIVEHLGWVALTHSTLRSDHFLQRMSQQ